MPTSIQIKKRLRASKRLFKAGDIDQLTKVCVAINRKQPQFTPIAHSWQMQGLSVEPMEDLFETFLILYHALNVGCKVKFPTFTMESIADRIEAFASFARFYETEAELGEADPDVIQFIKNPTLLRYASLSLGSIEGALPKEVTASYLALVKSLEDHLT